MRQKPRIGGHGLEGQPQITVELSGEGEARWSDAQGQPIPGADWNTWTSLLAAYGFPDSPSGVEVGRLRLDRMEGDPGLLRRFPELAPEARPAMGFRVDPDPTTRIVAFSLLAVAVASLLWMLTRQLSVAAVLLFAISLVLAVLLALDARATPVEAAWDPARRVWELQPRQGTARSWDPLSQDLGALGRSFASNSIGPPLPPGFLLRAPLKDPAGFEAWKLLRDDWACARLRIQRG
jgi:hypothetical protein